MNTEYTMCFVFADGTVTERRGPDPRHFIPETFHEFFTRVVEIWRKPYIAGCRIESRPTHVEVWKGDRRVSRARWTQ